MPNAVTRRHSSVASDYSQRGVFSAHSTFSGRTVPTLNPAVRSRGYRAHRRVGTGPHPYSLFPQSLLVRPSRPSPTTLRISRPPSSDPTLPSRSTGIMSALPRRSDPRSGRSSLSSRVSSGSKYWGPVDLGPCTWAAGHEEIPFGTVEEGGGTPAGTLISPNPLHGPPPPSGPRHCPRNPLLHSRPPGGKTLLDRRTTRSRTDLPPPHDPHTSPTPVEETPEVSPSGVRSSGIRCSMS